MNKFRITLSFLLVIVLGGAVGFLVVGLQNPDFHELTIDEMRETIIQQRDIAIAKAMAMGDYRCCITPVCTMCFMEANQWNNGKPGTCACDDLIAQGKDPCPQCKSGLVRNTGSSCEIISESCDVDVGETIIEL